MNIFKTKTCLAGFHGTTKRQGLGEKISSTCIGLFMLLYSLSSLFDFTRFVLQQDIFILSFREQLCIPVLLSLRRLPQTTSLCSEGAWFILSFLSLSHSHKCWPEWAFLKWSPLRMYQIQQCLSK